MKKINFDQYVRQNKRKFARIRGKLLENKMLKGGTKQKDSDELQALIAITSARIERWQKEKKFEIVSPRKYRI